MSEMGIDVIVEAFAVVVIGGLGSMRGAFAGALIVGVVKAGAIAPPPGVEMLALYVIVIAVLVLRPAGLFSPAPPRSCARPAPPPARGRCCCRPPGLPPP